jgi:hypothetical protein
MVIKNTNGKYWEYRNVAGIGSDKKNYSADDGIDGIIGLFGRNSGCSAERKSLGIPFQTIPQRRKMPGILY